MAKRTDRITMVIEPALKADSQSVAEEQGITLSEYICRLLKRSNTEIRFKPTPLCIINPAAQWAPISSCSTEVPQYLVDYATEPK